jgi:hypothetical protein
MSNLGIFQASTNYFYPFLRVLIDTSSQLLSVCKRNEIRTVSMTEGVASADIRNSAKALVPVQVACITVAHIEPSG